MEKIKVLYSGSFDPFTNGHLEIIKKAAKLFDIVYIGLCFNPSKTRRYDANEMAHAITLTLQRLGLDNRVFVQVYNKLTIDEAKFLNVNYLIRGIRNNIDYNYEENLASINQELSSIDTIYLRAGSLGNVSSSMVMELVKYGHDVSNYVPEEVNSIINKSKK